ncbi:glycosidase, partial [Pseudomonas sp. FW305-130]
DSESIWLHASDDILHWAGGGKIVSPRYPWEFVQMGNCGSPIEIDEGWLVFTHGVGMVRNYCVGACLLDKADPSRLLARTPEPILTPS